VRGFIALVVLAGYVVGSLALFAFGDFYWAFGRGYFLD
jgi:hypothetical protein